jgi:glycerophosphoryl diester phosphodiesterase
VTDAAVADKVTNGTSTKAALNTTYARLNPRALWDNVKLSQFYVAHRCGLEVAGEESMTAARLAVDGGCDMLDFDLQSLGDGVVAVMHDTTVDRTTNSTGNVADHTVQSYLKMQIDHAGLVGGSNWPVEAPPLWETILREFGNKVMLTAQVYDDAVLQAAHLAAQRLGIDKRTVMFQSTSYSTLAAIKALGYPAMFVTSSATPDWAQIAANGSDLVSVVNTPTQALVNGAHAAGLKVMFQAYRHYDKALQAALGVDGFVTDNPTYLRDAFTKRRTDLFKAQDRTPAHFRQAGTAGTFIAPDAFGWAVSPGNNSVSELGYITPANGSDFTAELKITLTSGLCQVWLGNMDAWDNNAAGKIGVNGYAFTITNLGQVRVEEFVDGSRAQYLGYNVSSNGAGTFTLGTEYTWRFGVTPTQVRWKRVDSGATGAYNSTTARNLRYLAVTSNAAVVTYRGINLGATF